MKGASRYWCIRLAATQIIAGCAVLLFASRGDAAQIRCGGRIIASTEESFIGKKQHHPPREIWAALDTIHLPSRDVGKGMTVKTALIHCTRACERAGVPVTFAMYVDDPNNEGLTPLINFRLPANKRKPTVKDVIHQLQDAAGLSGVLYLPGRMIMTPSVMLP